MAQYQAQNPQFGGLLYQTLIHYDNTNDLVLDLDRMWTQADNFVTQLTNGVSQGFNSPDGIYNRMVARRIGITQPISVQGAQSGQNLVLTFQDPTWMGFRVKDTVMDGAMNEGRVISVTAGSATIEPLFNPTTLTAGTHFLSGTTVYWTGDISGNFNSAGVTNLYRTYDFVQDYSSVLRDSCQIARREEIMTLAGKNGEFYTYSMQEKEMLRRIKKQDSIRFLLGTEGTKFSQVEGQINKTRSMRTAIMEDGTYANTGAALDVNTFNDLIDTVANYTGKVDQQLTIIPGRAALGSISSFYNNQLNFTGSTVKFGDRPVVNLDIREITVRGIKCNLMPMAMLNDNINIQAWHTNSVYIIDTSPIPSVNGVGSETPIQKIHFSKNPGPARPDKFYKAVTGIVQPGASSPMVGGTYEMASNPIDGYSVEYLEDSGYSMIADNWALFEFQN